MNDRALLDVKLPLPRGFFPAVKVNDADRRTMELGATRAVRDALYSEMEWKQSWLRDGSRQWKRIGASNGVTLCRARHAASSSSGDAISVMAFGSLPGTLASVVDGLGGSSPTDMQTQRRIMHSDYIDATVLHSFRHPSDNARNSSASSPAMTMALKWLALAPKSRTLFGYKHDICFCESTGMATDKNGKRVVFLVMQSIERRECPTLPTLGLRRSKVSACYIFHQLEDNSVGVFMSGRHHLDGYRYHWGKDTVLEGTWLGIANVLECTIARRLSIVALPSSAVSAAIDRNSKKNCKICAKKSSSIWKARTCAVCLKCVCRQCYVKRPVFVSSSVDAPGDVRVCKRCLGAIKESLKEEDQCKVGLQSGQQTASFLSQQTSTSSRTSAFANCRRNTIIQMTRSKAEATTTEAASRHISGELKIRNGSNMKQCHEKTPESGTSLSSDGFPLMEQPAAVGLQSCDAISIQDCFSVDCSSTMDEADSLSSLDDTGIEAALKRPRQPAACGNPNRNIGLRSSKGRRKDCVFDEADIKYLRGREQPVTPATDKDAMLERLRQFNVTAEVTYLLAKFQQVHRPM